MNVLSWHSSSGISASRRVPGSSFHQLSVQFDAAAHEAGVQSFTSVVAGSASRKRLPCDGPAGARGRRNHGAGR
eukprot:COSAG03_NODE_7554_length_901_cov_1.456359_1_plen_73_part_10